MYKKKSFFVTFEGIEGSGKTYQINKLKKRLNKKKISYVLTREPGGTKSAEIIRNLILSDYFHKNLKEQFNKYTDTLLYLAARNEHVINKIVPELKKKKIVICDRFVDSTIAYQVIGKKVDKKFVDIIHQKILGNLKPNLTFVLKVKIKNSLQRIKKRKKSNRYDKFSKKFYTNAQKAFLKLAKTNKKRYIVIDNSKNSPLTEKIIFDKFMKAYDAK